MSAETKPVAELAYELWAARGRPHGSALQDWVEAERQLAARGKAPALTEEAKEQSKAPPAMQGQAPAAKIPKQRKIKEESKAAQQQKPKSRTGKTSARPPGDDIGEG